MNDVWRQALAEVTGHPLTFAAEIVHFVLLVVIVRAALRSVVGKPLAARRTAIADAVAAADAADARDALADARAAALGADARTEAARIAADATLAAEAARREGQTRIEQEAAAVVAQAEAARATEQARAARATSERLIELVSAAVRDYLDQAGEAERRRATETLILDRLQELSG